MTLQATLTSSVSATIEIHRLDATIEIAHHATPDDDAILNALLEVTDRSGFAIGIFRKHQFPLTWVRTAQSINFS